MSLTSRGSNCHDDPFRWQRKSSLFLATSYLASLSGSHAAACTPPASMSAGLRPSLIVAHCRRRTSSSSLGHLVAMMRRSASFYCFLATGQPVASHRLCFHVEVFFLFSSPSTDLSSRYWRDLCCCAPFASQGTHLEALSGSLTALPRRCHAAKVDALL